MCVCVCVYNKSIIRRSIKYVFGMNRFWLPDFPLMDLVCFCRVCWRRELESTVEELRGNVINKKSRVNMSDVENMALVLSKSRYNIIRNIYQGRHEYFVSKPKSLRRRVFLRLLLTPAISRPTPTRPAPNSSVNPIRNKLLYIET